MIEKKYRTDFLFPQTDGWIGAGSVFNIVGNYFTFNYSDTEEDADYIAAESDWGVIGQDIMKVIIENPIIPISAI